jgi:hypothetical protein
VVAVIRHRYDERLKMDVLDVGERTYPVKVWRHCDEHGHSLRQAILEFENRWGLSITWGSMTYSDNHDHDEWRRRIGREPMHSEFIEEPHQVEVGVFSPVPRIIKGMSRETVDFFNDRYPAESEVREEMMKDRESDLACDPFGYLTDEGVNELADYVMTLPSHPEDSDAVEAIGAVLEELRYG